jgi:DNA-binding NarL/FixJ family response regulator
MITVSIVDDEKELRESIKTFIDGSPGFRCVSAYHSAETALKHLPQDHPDVVLMDIHLTGMSGIECVERRYRSDLQGTLCRGQRVYVETLNTGQAAGSDQGTE